MSEWVVFGITTALICIGLLAWGACLLAARADREMEKVYDERIKQGFAGGPVYCENCSDSPVCDFCKYYDFNGNESGAYTGDGWCNFHKKQEDPEGGCNDFYCFRLDKND